jgi:hypothetical protein
MIEISKRRIDPHFQYFYVKGVSKKIIEVILDIEEGWNLIVERRAMPFVKTEPSSFLEILVLTGVTEEEIKNYAEKNPQEDI